MFSSKKPSSEENVAKKSIKRMDTVVTGVILGGIIASIYGIKKLKEKEEENKNHEHLIEHHEPLQRKKGFFARIFGK